jgi:hypothetical protein
MPAGPSWANMVGVAGYDQQPGVQILRARLAAQIAPRPAPQPLDREERRKRVAALRARGMSHRAIAAELGIGTGTVGNDLARSTSYVPTEIIGLGGKRYPSRRPSATGRTDPLILEARHRRRERERYHEDPACRERNLQAARERSRERNQRLKRARIPV